MDNTRYFLVQLEITHKHTREQQLDNRKLGTIDGSVPLITQMLGLVKPNKDIGSVSLIGWKEISKEEYYN